MDAHDRIARQVRADEDDVLASIQLVQGDRALEDTLYLRLVDLLVEGLFVEVRAAYAAGELSTDELRCEVASLVSACRAAGLLPLARRGA